MLWPPSRKTSLHVRAAVRTPLPERDEPGSIRAAPQRLGGCGTGTVVHECGRAPVAALRPGLPPAVRCAGGGHGVGGCGRRSRAGHRRGGGRHRHAGCRCAVVGELQRRRLHRTCTTMCCSRWRTPARPCCWPITRPSSASRARSVRAGRWPSDAPSAAPPSASCGCGRSRGRDDGKAKLWVNKDRHAGLRDTCPPPMPGKEEQLAGTFVLGVGPALTAWRSGRWTPSLSTATAVSVPAHHADGAGERGRRGRPRTTEQDSGGGGGRWQEVVRRSKAVDILDDEGYLSKSTGPHPLYTSVKAYRAKDDPLSEEVSLEDRLRQHVPGTTQTRRRLGWRWGVPMSEFEVPSASPLDSAQNEFPHRFPSVRGGEPGNLRCWRFLGTFGEPSGTRESHHKKKKR